ncbi:MAG: NADP-dependent oxidoreductase [Pseudomonadota bacterium]
MPTSREIVLRRRPEGAPMPEDFALVERPLDAPAPGEVCIRTLWLSLDPYMRGRMRDVRSYAPPIPLGGVITGEVLGVVEETTVTERPVGSFVRAHAGWRTGAVLPAEATHPVDPSLAPLSTFLGVLGMPGLTAYAALCELGRPRAGETLAVAAATGPVGSLVGQLAKRLGLRTVAIVGGENKQQLARETFGFDAAVDHRSPGFAADLEAACPDGIDVYVELVVGHVLDAVLPLLNQGARIPLVGTIAHYNATDRAAGPDRLPDFLRQVLVKRLQVTGMIVTDFEHLRERFVDEVAPLVSAGTIRYLEDRVEGLEAAPAAFVRLLEGGNVGKALVRVAADA